MSPFQPRGKKTLTPTSLRACFNCPRLGYASLYRYGSDLIWSVGPKCPLPFAKLIFPRTTDLYPAYKHDNQTRGGFGLVCATGMYLPLGKWFFRNFKQEFLLNGKRVKCLRSNFGLARRLTLPLQKGDWTRWITLLAEPTFGNGFMITVTNIETLSDH